MKKPWIYRRRWNRNKKRCGGAQRRWKGGGTGEGRKAGPYHLSVWYWCSLLQLSVLHRMSGECHQVPPSGAPPPKSTTLSPPLKTPSRYPQPLVIRPFAPILPPSCFVTPGYPFILGRVVGGTLGPAPGGYKWCCSWWVPARTLQKSLKPCAVRAAHFAPPARAFTPPPLIYLFVLHLKQNSPLIIVIFILQKVVILLALKLICQSDYS